jgi:hypothetical protein
MRKVTILRISKGVENQKKKIIFLIMRGVSLSAARGAPRNIIFHINITPLKLKILRNLHNK